MESHSAHMKPAAARRSAAPPAAMASKASSPSVSIAAISAAPESNPNALNHGEFVIVGWSDPEGSRPFLGSLLLAYHDDAGRLLYAGRVGTGMSRAPGLTPPTALAVSRTSRLARLNCQTAACSSLRTRGRFPVAPLILSAALLWQEILKAAHLHRTAVAVMQHNRLLPAPHDRRDHSLFRLRLFILSPSRHRIAANEHRKRRRRNAGGKPPRVA